MDGPAVRRTIGGVSIPELDLLNQTLHKYRQRSRAYDAWEANVLSLRSNTGWSPG